MCATNFYEDQSPEAVARRAGGRRRYNAQRHEEAIQRRLRILEIVGAKWVLNPHGMQTQLAKALNVNRSTINRDFEALREEWRHTRICPVCRVWWEYPLPVHAYIYRIRKRENPTLQPSCCVRGYLAREAKRNKRRASELEQLFREVMKTR